MALNKCSECGNEVSDKATSCPKCGHPLGATPSEQCNAPTPPLQQQKQNKFFDPKANLKAVVRLVVIVAVLLGGVWLFIRFTAGEKAASRVTSTVLRQRVSLADTIEDLPASSFKAVSLSLPYTGSLSVEVAVRRGNDISVFLVTPDQIEKIKSKQGFRHVEGFQADKTKSYRRSGRVASGSYYLVLLDKSLGVLSQASSDIQVRAHLDP